ncbi:hypothetical protein [Sphingobacterium faecium]
MHPFRNKNKEHTNKCSNSCSPEVSFHPFVKVQGGTLGKNQFTSNDIEVLEGPIVKPDALEQVVLEMNLLKNKN